MKDECETYSLSELKETCNTLYLNTFGSKEELCKRLNDYLEETLYIKNNFVYPKSNFDVNKNINVINSDLQRLPLEVIINILKNFENVKDIQNFCGTNKSNYDLCKYYKQTICKHILKVHHVDYKDPTNFIYVYNNVNIKDYKLQDGKPNFVKILYLYNIQSLLKKIKCHLNTQVTSFPVYQNMEECDLSFNKLTHFYSQPRMKKCDCSHNNLITFSIQPSMEICNLNYNKITTFPIQPIMTHCSLQYNLLNSFNVQPLLKICDLQNNQINKFPIQPKMIVCYLNFNKLFVFPIQPKMEICHCSNNELISFPIQPKMITCILNNNKLTSFPSEDQPKMEYYDLNNNNINLDSSWG